MNDVAEKTMRENCDVLAEHILKAIEQVDLYPPYPYDSAAEAYRKRSLRAQQKEAVKKFLEELLR